MALRMLRFFAFCSPLFTLQSWRNSYPHLKQFHKNKQTKKKIEMIEKQHVYKLLTASFFVEGRIMLLLFISLNFIQINDHFHVVFSKINILEFALSFVNQFKNKPARGGKWGVWRRSSFWLLDNVVIAMQLQQTKLLAATSLIPLAD